jgi:hypothetical protein
MALLAHAGSVGSCWLCVLVLALCTGCGCTCRRTQAHADPGWLSEIKACARSTAQHTPGAERLRHTQRMAGDVRACSLQHPVWRACMAGTERALSSTLSDALWAGPHLAEHDGVAQAWEDGTLEAVDDGVRAPLLQLLVLARSQPLVVLDVVRRERMECVRACSACMRLMHAHGVRMQRVRGCRA